VEVVSGGLVDNIDKSRQTATLMKTRDVRVLFLYVSTYALSSTVLPVVQQAKVPVVILNPARRALTTQSSMLLVTGNHDRRMACVLPACAVPEVANVCLKAGMPFAP
jgi:L-arabinose isomerase